MDRCGVPALAHPKAESAAFMPSGVVPDVFDGSAWVGLIGFRMQKAGFGRGPAVPYFGDFNEINVRLYSREPDGTRGVVFLSLDADRLAVVLAARAAGIPYVWSHARFRPPQPDSPATGFSVRRFRRGATSDFAVVPASTTRGGSPAITSRPGSGCTPASAAVRSIPNTHSAWPLYRAELTVLEGGFISSAGLNVKGPPDSVLYSPGVRTRFGKPRVLGG